MLYFLCLFLCKLANYNWLRKNHRTISVEVEKFYFSAICTYPRVYTCFQYIKRYHYANMPMLYAAIVENCENDNY